MSFLTGTQMELLYAMPSNGTAVTAAAQTQLTGTPTTTNPSPQLPAYFFPSGQGGPGKSVIVRAGGFFTVGGTAVTNIIQIGLDATINTLGTAIAKTGAFTTTANVTNGAWFLDCMITCQGVGTSATLDAVGTLDWGTGNNAATAVTATYMIGAPNTTFTFNNATPYYIELWNTWSATTGSPTITCTQFHIFGCN